MQIKRETVLVNGLPVHYAVAGQGEPVIMVHGLAESTEIWRRNVATLAQYFRVYLIDLPGFGRMRKHHQHFVLEQSGVWLESWMQAIGLEKAALVGHSTGGYPCMALAAKPERVNRLVLVDSIGIPFGELARRWKLLALKSIIRTTPTFWPLITFDTLRAGSATINMASLQIHALDAAPAIAAIAVPTLIIWGEHDDLVPLRFGRQLHEQIAGSHLHVIPNTNHFGMFERASEFHRVLIPFLQGEAIGEVTTKNDANAQKS